jgi:hypothetical protein
VTLTTYDIGDQILITATFKVGTTATNPSTITLKIKYPDGTITSHTGLAGGLTNPSTGTWQYLEAPTMPGIHWYGWTGTGSAAAYEEDRYYIRTNHTT